jgi:exopolysaccharide production protein ExoY
MPVSAAAPPSSPGPSLATLDSAGQDATSTIMPAAIAYRVSPGGRAFRARAAAASRAGAVQTVSRRYPANETVFGRIADDGLIRGFDIVGALLVLAIAFPVMVLVALAVKLTSRGPVLFAHRRVGRHGSRFSCLKFRTMVTDADDQLKALLDRDPVARAEWQRSQKLRRDPRVTPIGRFLRRSSLDELPQVFNVLIGDMSLVGPRPIVESEIPRYGRHFAAYCRVRPGVTGLWQVQRHAGTSYRRRVAFDVSFARARSLRLYLLILARTVPAVLIGKGAW